MQLIMIAAAQWFLYNDVVYEFFLWRQHYI